MKSRPGAPAAETPDTAHTAGHDEGCGGGGDPWAAVESPVRDLGLEKPEVDSRGRYDEVVAMISDAVWRYELDGEGRLAECYISPVADRLLGVPEGTIGNNMETYFSYVEPEDLPNVREMLESGLRNLVKEAAAEYRLRRPDGSVLWVRTKGSAYLQPNGHVLGFGTTSDITDRKRAEEALKKNEAVLSCILNSIPLSIFWKDRESVYLGCNETFAAGANLRPEDVVGKTDYALPWSREDTEAYRADDHEVMASGRAKMHITEQQHHPDGSCIWLDTTKIPLVDSEGKVYGVLGIYDDVTERKQMEDELRDAKDAADAANVAKSQFLANMSHEIRTPMTAILGYADLILDEEATPTTRHYMAVIKRNGEHLMELIGEILDLSKIESGNLQIELTRCSPVELVAGVASLMRNQAAAKNLHFTTELCDHLPETILTDPLRLRQVLVNLVGNAIKFTNHGEVRLAARVGCEGERAQLCFDVTDTGIGMKHEQLGKLFQPFSQVDSSSTRKFGGTGLGLCISKRLAESLGGGITVQSAPGEGSTFTVTIDPEPVEGRPAAADARKAAVEVRGTTRSAAADEIALQGRILLAEDVAENRQLIRLLTSRAGGEVTAVENGRLAVEAALAASEAGAPFDVIVMDMQMPVMDGYEATRLLRSRGYERPIVALTAHMMSDDCQKCLDAGCDDYLGKPIDRQAFLAKVARWMDSARGGAVHSPCIVGEADAPSGKPA